MLRISSFGDSSHAEDSYQYDNRYRQFVINRSLNHKPLNFEGGELRGFTLVESVAMIGYGAHNSMRFHELYLNVKREDISTYADELSLRYTISNRDSGNIFSLLNRGSSGLTLCKLHTINEYRVRQNYSGYEVQNAKHETIGRAFRAWKDSDTEHGIWGRVYLDRTIDKSDFDTNVVTVIFALVYIS